MFGAENLYHRKIRFWSNYDGNVQLFAIMLSNTTGCVKESWSEVGEAAKYEEICNSYTSSLIISN